jgi:hypothetical protein
VQHRAALLHLRRARERSAPPTQHDHAAAAPRTSNCWLTSTRSSPQRAATTSSLLCFTAFRIGVRCWCCTQPRVSHSDACAEAATSSSSRDVHPLGSV